MSMIETLEKSMLINLTLKFSTAATILGHELKINDYWLGDFHSLSNDAPLPKSDW